MKLFLIIFLSILAINVHADCSGPTQVAAEFAKSDMIKAFPENKAVKNATFSADCKVGWLSQVLPEFEIKKNHALLMSCGVVLTFKNKVDMEQMALDFYQANRGKESLSTLDAYGIAEVAVPVCGIVR